MFKEQSYGQRRRPEKQEKLETSRFLYDITAKFGLVICIAGKSLT